MVDLGSLTARATATARIDNLRVSWRPSLRGAMRSFRRLVRNIRDPRLGKVQPVVLTDENLDKVNVTYRRSGAGASSISSGFNCRPAKPEAVVVDWTVEAPTWQDAEDVNAKIVDALLANPTALAHPEAYLSTELVHADW